MLGTLELQSLRFIPVLGRLPSVLADGLVCPQSRNLGAAVGGCLHLLYQDRVRLMLISSAPGCWNSPAPAQDEGDQTTGEEEVVREASCVSSKPTGGSFRVPHRAFLQLSFSLQWW